MLNKVLVANRGEIAIRVMRGCKEMGISTVAVYSEADRKSLFVKYADEAFLIGPPPAAQSYLQIDKIIDIAEKTNTDGIHPGYGFLAENLDFCNACESNGIEFIGPKPFSIELMGSKVDSKQTMMDAKVPVVPGITEGTTDPNRALEFAREIGFPVMVKAEAGGGGIGMDFVYKEEDFARVFENTSRIAKANFGNPTMLVEKFIEAPRHIEFQVIADKKGNTIHVLERECSMQRRNQKVIEETPSMVMSEPGNETLRERMGAAAVLAAKTAKYENAGTCEFMYSPADKKYYFLEMNTRLQVEHPITEEVTNVDLVHEQLRVASGLDLQYEQSDIKHIGHSIECRINAEDPVTWFPAPGKIRRYHEPGGIGVRVDSGVYAGFEIPTFYDSMISKLITWGRNRNEAVARMLRALDEYVITGVKHNKSLHKVLLCHPKFIEGDYTTKFMSEHNIAKRVEEQLVVDQMIEEKMTLGDDNAKYAAIMAAINSYVAQLRAKQFEKA